MQRRAYQIKVRCTVFGTALILVVAIRRIAGLMNLTRLRYQKFCSLRKGGIFREIPGFCEYPTNIKENMVKYADKFSKLRRKDENED